MAFAPIQQEVDAWISQFEEGYFAPLPMLARVTEEVGELARALMHHYGGKKQKAGEELGDIGEETVPALAVLRESAHRLSRLAIRYDGPDAVSEIVAELYSVERAVASLLGAIALASDAPVSREAAASAPAGPATRDAEWTTTGRLEDAVGP